MRISTGTPVTIPQDIKERLSEKEQTLREASEKVLRSFQTIIKERDEQLRPTAASDGPPATGPERSEG